MGLFRRRPRIPGSLGEPNANFYSYFPDEEAARGYASGIDGLGLSVKEVWRNDDAPDGDQWSVPAEAHVETLAQVHKIGKRLEKLAASYGGEYDGHDVAAG